MIHIMYLAKRPFFTWPIFYNPFFFSLCQVVRNHWSFFHRIQSGGGVPLVDYRISIWPGGGELLVIFHRIQSGGGVPLVDYRISIFFRQVVSYHWLIFL